MRKIKKNMMNVLVLIITIFIMLILLEWGLRLFYPQLTSAEVWRRAKTFTILEPNEYYMFSMTPYAEITHLGSAGDFKVNIKINSMGLRDEEFNDSKDSILVVGDSFAFGYGVEHNETYSEILESLLNDIQVINSGFGGGYGPDTQYLFIERNIDYFNPRIVILGYCVGNDITDPVTNQTLKAEKGRMTLKNSFLNEAHFFLAAHYHSYILFKNFMLNVFGGKLNLLINYSGESSPYDKVYDQQYKKGWAVSEEMIMKMNNLFKERNISFIIMIAPSKIQIQDWEYFKKTSDKEIIRDKPNLLLNAFAKEKNISIIDLLVRFDNTQCSDCYFKNDPHWNRKGHRIAAEELYNFITENNLLENVKK